MMRVLIKGLQDVDKALADRQKAIRRAVAVGTFKAAVFLQGAARRRILQGPKTGKQRGKHRSSKPGEAPANDTGNLQRSIKVVNRGLTGDQAVCEVVSNTEYAMALEFGRADGTVAERPFMRPSIDDGVQASRLLQAEIEAAR